MSDQEVFVDPLTGRPITSTETLEGPPPSSPDDKEDSNSETLVEAISDITDMVDKISPNKEVRVFKIGEREYIQRPLKYLAKLEFFAHLASSLEKAISQDKGISITMIMDSVKSSEEMVDDEVTSSGFNLGMFRDPDIIIESIAKVAQLVPDFMSQNYCIWLGIPRGEREQSKLYLEENMEDAEGLAIMETFFDQNIEAVQSFFDRDMPRIFQRAAKIFKQSSQK